MGSMMPNRSMKTRIRLGGACMAAWAMLLLSGCHQPPQETAPAFAYEKEFPRDAITVAERINLDHITTAQAFELTLAARHTEAIECAFPLLKDGEKLGEFAVQSSRQSEPALNPDGQIAVTKTYVLEPFLPGEYELPSMSIEYWDKTQPDAAHQTVQTDAVKITVASVLAPGQEASEIKEITPPMELPPSVWRWLAPLLAALALLALGAGYWAWRGRKRATAAIAAEPPHITALRRLDALRAERLLEQGEYKLFYFQVSNIIRHYLEDGFGMRAPERTTEEFLAELDASRTLAASHQMLLRSFLKHCDLVKFAEHHPSETEAEEVFTTCRRFVEEMHAAQAQAASEASAGRS